jgi:hypothetical protein
MTNELEKVLTERNVSSFKWKYYFVRHFANNNTDKSREKSSSWCQCYKTIPWKITMVILTLLVLGLKYCGKLPQKITMVFLV